MLFGYDSENPNINSKNTILSLMFIGGFLAYHEQQIFVPNKEVMKKFEALLLAPEMGNINLVLEQSKQLLEATINQDEETVAQLIDRAHSINSSYFISYRGKKLVVAIYYDKDSEDKKHFVKIEELL